MPASGLFSLLAVAAVYALAPVSCRATPRPAPPYEDTSLKAPPAARLAAIARKCARIASCAHSHDPPYLRDPAECVDFWLSTDASGSVQTCLSDARSCEAVCACIHPPGHEDAAAYCRAHPGSMTACSGNRLIVCAEDDPSESTLVDCALAGGQCDQVEQAGGLSTHGCVDPVRCPRDLTKAWCDGRGAIVSCHDGVMDRTACALGSVCESHVEGDFELAAMCEAPGHSSCAMPGLRRCEGNRLVACEVHGHFAHERAIDCAAGGFVCSGVEGGAECTNGPPMCSHGHPTCEGNALAFCAGGARVRIDCGELGMGTCDPDGRGTDAVCRPLP